MPGQFSQRNHTADAAAVDGWHELSVANPTFLLERLGSECTDLQGLRALTVNWIDAIAALGDRAVGRVVWDPDWQRFDAPGGRVRKPSVTDTGTGMTAEQLRQYINQLASSGRERSAAGNFGVGAKVAARSRNPHGLEYRSWCQGQGALVCFKRHPDGRWGLEPQHWPDGRSDFWRPLDEQDKPWLLRGHDHGTQVVLLGQHGRHDTTEAPTSVTESRRQWISRYLNGRFPRLPQQVEVLVRDPHRHPGELQRVHGEQYHLQQHAIAAGVVELSDAIAQWWVLDDDHRGRRREGTLWASAGHVAAVFGDELYDVLPQTRSGYGRLQDFGIRFGYGRVVLHIEPHVQADRLQCNTARTLLLLDHEPLPWARWGEEFAAAMPVEILRLQEGAASADVVPRQEAIRQRVTAILPLYSFSRYRPISRPRQTPTQPAADDRNESPETSTIAPVAARRGTAADAASATSGEQARRAPSAPPAEDPRDKRQPHPTVSLPDVAWISARDGSRAIGDLEDQAARYHLDRHELTINADFRAITDLISHWQDRYRGIAGARAVIEAQVREWCEQILVEVVLAARSSSWTPDQLDAPLSPGSLTAALLPRQLLHATLQKRLAQKLGASQLVDPVLDLDVDRVARLLADGLPQHRSDREPVRAVALGHQRPGERLAVDRPPDLHEAAGTEEFGHIVQHHARPSAWVVAFLKLGVEFLDHDYSDSCTRPSSSPTGPRGARARARRRVPGRVVIRRRGRARAGGRSGRSPAPCPPPCRSRAAPSGQHRRTRPGRSCECRWRLVRR